MEHRILIAFPFPGQRTAGGPEGFISQLLRPYSLPGLAVTAVPHESASAVSRRLRQLTVLLTRRARRWQMTAADFAARESLFHAAGLSNVKFIWFMDSRIYQMFEPFIRPEQTVIYQPHCPELPWEEIAADTAHGVQSRRELEACTRRLVQRAKIIVLPSAGARLIYQSLLPPAADVRYVQSGAALPAAPKPPPLDPQFTYLLYIGRRLPIKGFDLIFAAFQLAYTRRPDLRLLVCGAGDRLDHPGIIDIGFTLRVHDWIAAADYVINANRQSYLDLSVMETLAIGTPLLMTCTHGHEIFRAWTSPALRCLDAGTPETLASVLTQCSAALARQPGLREINRALYAREFAVDRYHSRLAAFSQDVLQPSVASSSR